MILLNFNQGDDRWKFSFLLCTYTTPI